MLLGLFPQELQVHRLPDLSDKEKGGCRTEAIESDNVRLSSKRKETVTVPLSTEKANTYIGESSTTLILQAIISISIPE